MFTHGSFLHLPIFMIKALQVAQDQGMTSDIGNTMVQYYCERGGIRISRNLVISLTRTDIEKAEQLMAYLHFKELDNVFVCGI